MSAKDKLEIGLKPDAPYRPDNLPDFQQDGEDPQKKAAEDDGTDPTSPDPRRRQAAQSPPAIEANEPDDKIPDQ